MKSTWSRALIMWLSFAVFMGAAGSAFASGNVIAAPGLGGNSAWTVYAFGNAQAVSDAFRALTNFSSSGTFQALVSMIAVIGVIGVGASSGFNPAVAKRFIGYIVGVFLVTYVLFGANNGGPLVVNVEVIDSVDMTWKAPVTVPAVVGIPASVISTAGYRMTQAIEASFALPDALKLSNGAPFNLAASMIADASQARITDPNLASSMAYYVQDCFTVGVAQGVLRADSLLWSTNFLNDIKFDSNAVMVNTLLQDPVGTPGVVTCSTGWSLINKAVNAQGDSASSFLKDASSWAKTPALSVVNAAADSTLQWATNNGVTDGGSLIKQAAVLSAFRGSYSQAAAQTGNSDVLTGLAMSQAIETQRSSWITGAEIFNKTMGYIFAILQVFVYALTPLVLCAALVPGLGLALLKNFAQILLWLAIWQPMLSIVNFIVLSMQQADLGGALSSGTGSYGFTLSNMGIITEKTANLRAAASFVGTMVPALAWAMVKGSVDFSRVIGSAVGENFAAGAANTMSTGSYSLNQASMDSFTSNKHSMVATGAWGGGHSTVGAVGSHSSDLGGSKLPTVGEQNYNVTSANSQGVGKNGSVSRNTSVVDMGSSSNTVSTSDGVNSSTNNQVSSGDAYSSGVVRTAGGGVEGGVQLKPNGLPDNRQLSKDGGHGLAANPSGGKSANGATPPKSNATPANLKGKPKAKASVTPSASARLNDNISSQKTEMANHQKVTASSIGTSHVRQATALKNATHSGSIGKMTSQGTTYSDNENRQITAASPVALRAEIAAAALASSSGDWMMSGRWAPAPLKGSEAINTVNHLSAQDSVEQDYKREVGEVAKVEKEQIKETNALKGGADGGVKKVQSEAGGLAHTQDKVAKGGKQAAEVSPEAQLIRYGAEHAVEPVVQLAKDGVDSAKKLVNSAKNYLTGKPAATQPAAGQPSSATPTPNGQHTPQTKQPQSKGQHTPHATQPAAGQPSGATPTGQHTPQTKQPQPKGQHTPHATQPAAGQPSGQPENKAQAKQAPSAPQAVAMAQPPVMPQAPEQPPKPPEMLAQVTPPTTPPDVIAQAPQQPVSGSQGGLPNIFDGDKGGANPANLQNQIKLAENRVQILENTTRNIDGILASAEGLPANKLPDLINQARDLTRKA